MLWCSCKLFLQVCIKSWQPVRALTVSLLGPTGSPKRPWPGRIPHSFRPGATVPLTVYISEKWLRNANSPLLWWFLPQFMDYLWTAFLALDMRGAEAFPWGPSPSTAGGLSHVPRRGTFLVPPGTSWYRCGNLREVLWDTRWFPTTQNSLPPPNVDGADAEKHW